MERETQDATQSAQASQESAKTSDPSDKGQPAASTQGQGGYASGQSEGSAELAEGQGQERAHDHADNPDAGIA